MDAQVCFSVADGLRVCETITVAITEILYCSTIHFDLPLVKSRFYSWIDVCKVNTPPWLPYIRLRGTLSNRYSQTLKDGLAGWEDDQERMIDGWSNEDEEHMSDGQTRVMYKEGK